jgi:hypothetical protein
MNPWVIPFGAWCVLVLAGIAVAIVSLYHSRALVCAVERRAAAERADIVKQIETLAAQVEALKQEPRPDTSSAAGLPLKPGFNLSKRSQALRMARHGSQPQEIAEALEVPAQEIELLLKVHSIVVSNV